VLADLGDEADTGFQVFGLPLLPLCGALRLGGAARMPAVGQAAAGCREPVENLVRQ